MGHRLSKSCTRPGDDGTTGLANGERVDKADARVGAFGDVDVPTRGRAWIEEATGRVLQTELEVGRGRGIPMVLTKFKVDDKLQVTVPVEMRTQNPDGLALYSNYRRFEVATEAVIPKPPPPPDR